MVGSVKYNHIEYLEERLKGIILHDGDGIMHFK